MPVTIAEERPDQADIVALIAASDAFSLERYPPEGHFGTDIAGLLVPGMCFFVARLGGRAIGTGALFLPGDGTAEVKRMFVAEAARGHGTGRLMMDRILACARTAGVTRLNLETGPLNTEAVSLYRRFGFVECGPFPPYEANPYSLFMTRTLDDAPTGAQPVSP